MRFLLQRRTARTFMTTPNWWVRWDERVLLPSRCDASPFLTKSPTLICFLLNSTSGNFGIALLVFLRRKSSRKLRSFLRSYKISLWKIAANLVHSLYVGQYFTVVSVTKLKTDLAIPSQCVILLLLTWCKRGCAIYREDDYSGRLHVARMVNGWW